MMCCQRRSLLLSTRISSVLKAYKQKESRRNLDKTCQHNFFTVHVICVLLRSGVKKSYYRKLEKKKVIRTWLHSFDTGPSLRGSSGRIIIWRHRLSIPRVLEDWESLLFCACDKKRKKASFFASAVAFYFFFLNGPKDLSNHSPFFSAHFSFYITLFLFNARKYSTAYRRWLRI